MSNQSVFGKMLDHVLPPMPPFLEMTTAQAELLARALSLVVECLSEPDPAKVQALSELETASRALRQKHLDKLSDSFSTPIDRADLLQAINTLHTPVIMSLQLVEEMTALNLLSDNYCLEMTVVLRETAQALHRGYGRLADTPALADPDALMGLQCLSSVDQVYRRALGRLFSIDDHVAALQSKAAEAQIEAFVHVVDILKRRETYRHLRNIAGSMTEAAGVLHAIVVQIG